MRRAIVIGGSISGLFAALLLRKAGWGVDVYERIDDELAARGAGIVTHDGLFRVMAEAGIDEKAATTGVRVPGRRLLNHKGEIVRELALPQILTSWGYLYRLLRGALPSRSYHIGRNLTRVEVGADDVSAFFEEGGHETADLVVGADGLFSTVRRQFAPTITPSYAGYIAWRGLVEEDELSATTREAIGDHFAFCLPTGEQMLGYPVAGDGDNPTRNHRRYNFVWYRPAPPGPSLAELLLDVDGVQRGLSIPPNKIRTIVIEGMRRDAERLLAPQFAEVVRKAPLPFIQTIQDLESPEMILAPRVAVVGDAAFVARPHVGMGVSKAAGDALALATALRNHVGDIELGLRDFNARRQPFGAAVVRRARELGAYMRPDFAQAVRRGAVDDDQVSADVMTKTAVATEFAE